MMFNIFNKRNNWNNTPVNKVKTYTLSPEEIEKLCIQKDSIKNPGGSIGYTKTIDKKFKNMRQDGTEYWSATEPRMYM